MTDANDILIEIGTEELPPGALTRLATALADGLVEGLDKAELGHGEAHWYASPRRLAVLVEAVANRQQDKDIQRRGPALKAAYDADGQLTRAATGFASSCGVAPEQLETMETDKGSWLVCNIRQSGEATAALIPAMLEQSLNRLPIPRRMRWGSGEAEFVRPVHWIVALQGDAVIPATILGLETGRLTRGHRFHHPEVVSLQHASEYLDALRNACVLADFNERRERIRSGVTEAAAAEGVTAVIEDDLLDEVTALNEWPVAIAGRFDEGFLQMPAEVLISSMKDHQKYFHTVDDSGNLQAWFVTVSNIDSSDPAAVRAGNERVIRPRLSDAAFFWDQDRKQPLDALLPRLENVVFQKQLGTLANKTTRTRALALWLAERCGAGSDDTGRAASLAKCDLMTDMVGEFPSLQGLIGRHYAHYQGENDKVALALDEQYMPRYAGDAIPATAEGQCLAMADKLDTLSGIFGIGQIPTGDKDPFALRRAALGLLRILIEAGHDIDLADLIEEAVKTHADHLTNEDTASQLFDFCLERLRGYLHDQGIETPVFDAVAARRPTRPLDFQRRVQAVDAFRQLPEAESLSAANKRIRNILRKSETEPATELDPSLLQEPAEQTLAYELGALAPKIEPLLEQRDYAAVLSLLASLRAPVDAFFEGVMVNCEDAAVRANRLRLLADVADGFLEIADISLLQS